MRVKKDNKEDIWFFKTPKEKDLKNRFDIIAKRKGFNLKTLMMIVIEDYVKREERKGE